MVIKLRDLSLFAQLENHPLNLIMTNLWGIMIFEQGPDYKLGNYYVNKEYGPDR